MPTFFSPVARRSLAKKLAKRIAAVRLAVAEEETLTEGGIS
jgi:hypothetical protein